MYVCNVMDDITQVFSGNLEKCYSVDMYILVGSHIRVTEQLGLFGLFCDNRMTGFCGVVHATRGSRQMCVRNAAKPRSQCQGHLTDTERRKKDFD